MNMNMNNMNMETEAFSKNLIPKTPHVTEKSIILAEVEIDKAIGMVLK